MSKNKLTKLIVFSKRNMKKLPILVLSFSLLFLFACQPYIQAGMFYNMIVLDKNKNTISGATGWVTFIYEKEGWHIPFETTNRGNVVKGNLTVTTPTISDDEKFISVKITIEKEKCEFTAIAEKSTIESGMGPTIIVSCWPPN